MRATTRTATAVKGPAGRESGDSCHHPRPGRAAPEAVPSACWERGRDGDRHRRPLRPSSSWPGWKRTYRSGRVGFRALNGVDLVHRRRRDGGGHRPVGQRQDDHHQPHRRHRPAHGRHGDGQREPPGPDDRGAARGLARPHRRHRLPVLPADADAHRGGERHAAAGPGPAWRPARERKAVASRHLATVGLGDRGDRLPLELSGGEQQRVAIARAMACEPPILLGDEPTGNLDTALAREMFDLLKGLNENGTDGRVRHPRPGAGRAGLPDRVRPRWRDRRRHGAAAMSTPEPQGPG